MLKFRPSRIKNSLRPARFRLARLAVTLHSTRQKIERVRKHSRQSLKRLQPVLKPRLERIKRFSRKQITHYKTTPYLALAARAGRQLAQAGQSWRRMEMPLASGAALSSSPALGSQIDADFGMEFGQGQVIAPFTPPETPARPTSSEAQTPAPRWKKPPPGARLFSRTEEVTPGGQEKPETTQQAASPTPPSERPQETKTASRPPSVQRLPKMPVAPQPPRQEAAPRQAPPAGQPEKISEPPSVPPATRPTSRGTQPTAPEPTPPVDRPTSRSAAPSTPEQVVESQSTDSLQPPPTPSPRLVESDASPPIQPAKTASPLSQPADADLPEPAQPPAPILSAPGKPLPPPELSGQSPGEPKNLPTPAAPEQLTTRSAARLPFLPLIYRHARPRQVEAPASPQPAEPSARQTVTSPAITRPIPTKAGQPPALRTHTSVVQRLTQKTIARLAPPNAQPPLPAPARAPYSQPRRAAQPTPSAFTSPTPRSPQAPPRVESIPSRPAPQPPIAPSPTVKKPEPSTYPSQFPSSPPLPPEEGPGVRAFPTAEDLEARALPPIEGPGEKPLSQIKQPQPQRFPPYPSSTLPPLPLREGPGVKAFSRAEGPGVRAFPPREGPGVRAAKPSLSAKRASRRATQRQFFFTSPAIRRLSARVFAPRAPLPTAQRAAQAAPTFLRRNDLPSETSPQVEWTQPRPPQASQPGAPPFLQRLASRQPLPQTVINRSQRPQPPPSPPGRGAGGEGISPANLEFPLPSRSRPAGSPPGAPPPPRSPKAAAPDTRSRLEMTPLQRRSAAPEAAVQSAPSSTTQMGVVQRMLQDSDSDLSDDTGLSDLTQSSSGARSSQVNVHALAKQVYPIIKRLLLLEKERSTGRIY